MNLHSFARFPRLWCAVLLGGLLAFGPVAQATTYYVAKSGNDANAGTRQAPFLTVQRGASAAQPGLFTAAQAA